MRALVLASTMLLFAVAAPSAQYHEPVFLTGGDAWSTATTVATGLWVIDGRAQTATSLFPASFRNSWIMSACMDADNRRIVFTAYGGTHWKVENGLFRFDPATQTLQTLWQGNYNSPGPAYLSYSVLVNQDGDYVFGAEAWGGPSTHNLLKVDAGRRLTTIFSPQAHLGGDAELNLALGCDIDSGRYLVSLLPRSVPTLLHDWTGPLLRVDPNIVGQWSTFSNGGGGGMSARGWYQDHGHLSQDHATGAVRMVAPRQGVVVEQMPGMTPSASLYQCGRPASYVFTFRVPGMFDLQSAAKRRYVAPAYYQQAAPVPGGTACLPGFLAIDETSYFATGFLCDPLNKAGLVEGATRDPSVFEFYRGRHVGSTRSGPSRWTLLFSVPHHAGKHYLAAAGISGVRPPVQLPDGRRIWLNVDDVTRLSLVGALKPHFDAGPGVLDASGEAQGTLDLRSIGPTGGLPVWVALVVLDPQAPGGIAYIPDTYVIRAP